MDCFFLIILTYKFYLDAAARLDSKRRRRSMLHPSVLQRYTNHVSGYAETLRYRALNGACVCGRQKRL